MENESFVAANANNAMFILKSRSGYQLGSQNILLIHFADDFRFMQSYFMWVTLLW